ncbi:hypothetical protein BdWA1_000236 [Babesia duncani]|uniref:Uncharacterized protein n=1 Tax=Babesia duncani TaxID=323732 RepID=A0AAD9PMQ3_9APIC|nr:hypothetical protein BdWA1_000236 [Babesia duncani]
MRVLESLLIFMLKSKMARNESISKIWRIALDSLESNSYRNISSDARRVKCDAYSQFQGNPKFQNVHVRRHHISRALFGPQGLLFTEI